MTRRLVTLAIAAVLAPLSLSLAAPPAPAAKVAAAKKEKAPSPTPTLVEGSDRTLTITDATTAAEVRLAPPGQTTSLTFPVAIAVDKVLLVDPKQRVFPPLAQGSTLALVAKEALPPGTTVPLTVTLVDGTELNFAVAGSAAGFDRFLRVEVKLLERAGADNTQRLKSQLQEVQAKLDECQQAGADLGVAKLAAVILKQDLSKPDVWTVEKRANRSGIDKQNRLLVETQYVFRLFDLTYLVLTAENRDPTQSWVLERVELAAAGTAASTDIKVLGVEQELNAIPPGEMSKLVVAFRIPVQDTKTTFTLKLLEKNGNRHFELKDLHL